MSRRNRGKRVPPTGELRRSQVFTLRAGQMWFDEGGGGNDFSEIDVRDERNNNHRRPLSDAPVPGANVLGTCWGRKPWLWPRVRERCTKPNRLLIRSASTAAAAQTLSVIAIPNADAAIRVREAPTTCAKRSGRASDPPRCSTTHDHLPFRERSEHASTPSASSSTRTGR